MPIGTPLTSPLSNRQTYGAYHQPQGFETGQRFKDPLKEMSSEEQVPEYRAGKKLNFQGKTDKVLKRQTPTGKTISKNHWQPFQDEATERDFRVKFPGLVLRCRIWPDSFLGLGSEPAWLALTGKLFLKTPM